MNQSALKSIRAHIRQTPPKQHKPLADDVQIAPPQPKAMSMPMLPEHHGTGELMTATHKLDFAKRVAHFRRLFAGEPHPQPKQPRPHVAGTHTETGRKLHERPRQRPKVELPSFRIG
jgi:hypothetical protein